MEEESPQATRRRSLEQSLEVERPRVVVEWRLAIYLNIEVWENTFTMVSPVGVGIWEGIIIALHASDDWFRIIGTQPLCERYHIKCL